MSCHVQWSLLVEVTFALNEIFNLDDGEAMAMINVLIGMVGEDVDDLLEVEVHVAI